MGPWDTGFLPVEWVIGGRSGRQTTTRQHSSSPVVPAVISSRRETTVQHWLSWSPQPSPSGKQSGIADTEYLWYIPNQNEPGHRGDTAVDGHNSLDTLTEHALALERNGWQGALIGTSWGRPDTFTVATALAARTSTFEPLIAVRPGYWRPANFASSVATLDHLSGGRVRINIVSGKDNLGAYGDGEAQQADRYDRTREFIQIIRRLWTEENLTYRGEHFSVENSTAVPRIAAREGRPHPKIYFGGRRRPPNGWPPPRPTSNCSGASRSTVSPNASTGSRNCRRPSTGSTLHSNSVLRITTFIRDTTDQAWEAQARG